MTHALFVSLGTSQAIVPEAFLLPQVTFTSVHILTTERMKTELIQEFFSRSEYQGKVTCCISRVAGFTDLDNEDTHFHFEETLYRWILETGLPPESRSICLSGGFKTMSAAMQKAAAVLGASEVFHVLADNFYPTPNGQTRPPSSIPEILESLAANRIRHIRLGPETGWPQFRTARPADYPLTIESLSENERRIAAPDFRFRQCLQEIVSRSHNIARSWERLGTLPFPSLAALPPEKLAWLESPLDAEADRPWVAALPKIDLHCHLGGFATHGELLEEVRAAAVHPEKLPPLGDCSPPEGWPEPRESLGLEAYMQLGDNNGSALLKDPGCLRRHCELLYEHLREQNVAYAEIRCSPANYATPERSPWQVLTEIKETFDRCRVAASVPLGGTGPTSVPLVPTASETLAAPVVTSGTLAPTVHLILIATRKPVGPNDHRATIARHLALAVTAAEHWTRPNECRVVGVDLAGYEDKETRAHYYREEFAAIHRCGLSLTVHAGENDDAEGIWSAVFDLNALRLGHALHLREAPALLQSVIARRITVEMCPYANFQIKGFAPMPGHALKYPLLEYLRAGVRVTINTDNIGISAASLTDNFLWAAHLCPRLSRLDVLHLLRHALEGAFASPDERHHLEALLNQHIATSM